MLKKDHMDWKKAISLVADADCDADTLPFSTPCPITDCRGLLTVYNDYNDQAPWLACGACGTCGDVVQFGARVWGLPAEDVVGKFAAAGVTVSDAFTAPGHFASYLNEYFDKRQRFTDMFERARHNLANDSSADLRRLQNKLGIKLDLDRERWLAGPGLFVGGVDRLEVESTYRPLTQKPCDEKGGSMGAVRLFIGQHWQDVLAIPMCSVPGKIRAFMFAGRELDPAVDVIVRPTGRRKRGHTILDKYDCGIALQPAINYAVNNLLVMDDPLLALQLQCWYMQDNSDPYPLVSMYSSLDCATSPLVWSNVSQRLVFWGRPSALMFAHARATGARVCTAGFTVDGPIKTFRRTPLTEWASRVDSEALPWEAALEAQLVSLKTNEAERILVGMGMTRSDHERIFRNAPDALKSRLDAYWRRSPPTFVYVGSKAVRCESDGWYDDSNNEPVCEAALVIEKVIHYEDGARVEYAGHIGYKGEKYPFCEKSEVIEDDPFIWMRRTLLCRGAGLLVSNVAYAKEAVNVAIKSSRPVVVRGVDRVGWDRDARQFVFPNFAITEAGEVVDTPFVARADARLPGKLPRRSATMTEDDVKELGADPLPPAFWALAACVAYNVLADVSSRRPVDVALIGGKTYKAGVTAAKVLGCVCEEPAPWLASKSVNRHGYPVLFDRRPSARGEWLRWLADGDVKNCLAALDPYAGNLMALWPDWQVVDVAALNDVGVPASASKVVPSFLRHFAKSGFRLAGGEDNTHLARLASTMREWFSGLGGSFPVGVVSAFPAEAQKVATALADLAALAFVDGHVEMGRAGFESTGAAILSRRAEGGDEILVPKHTLLAALAAKGLPPPDTAAVGYDLRSVKFQKTYYWCIPADLFDRRVEILETGQSRYARTRER